MNVFYLSKDPIECAQQHCDKHVVKMIVESAQLLSTAHRVLDGLLEVQERPSKKSVRKVKYWRHPVLELEENLYRASHVGHPSGKWVRETRDQYMYLYDLFHALSQEYTFRYKKEHSTFVKIDRYLSSPPEEIRDVRGFREPPQCMPHEYHDDEAVQAYRNFYIGEKIDFIRYTRRRAPDWLRFHLENYHRNSRLRYEKQIEPDLLLIGSSI